MKKVLMALALLILLGVAPVRAEDILCPETDAKGAPATPGDIATVQADIERINLCVERARLLKQLDDVMKERQEVLNKIAQPDLTQTGLGVPMPALPAGALPNVPGIQTGNVPPADLKPGEVRINAPKGAPLDAANAVNLTDAPTWSIRKIWGQGAAMRAQLSDGSGTLLNVVKGDPLPDGAVVETVSVKGVAVSRNGKITDLSWEQVVDSKKL